ncbi:PREDICTED: ATP synthase F(0) complex subunit C3, mitochondrial-like [Phaethon lepturus]|uniref:ATP synthase F(0) complex subunit C3, mitochondrial-like n=1 Tax=Phaethon lepturus TaxID=97097 RepID=UPI0005304762|nr:PREDICTED: ATP synthase F(0) complex subunit C3, mitochondrial-like [Phaethon lepturus]
MYTCAKFVSAPALVRRSSRVLCQPLSASVLSNPEARTEQVTHPARTGGHGNPSLKQQLFSYAILGFALSEAMGLFCLMVAFLILFAM